MALSADDEEEGLEESLVGQVWSVKSQLTSRGGEGGLRMCLEPNWKCSSQKSLVRTIVSFFLLEHFWLCFCLSPHGILVRTGAEMPTSSPLTPTSLQEKHRQQCLLWRGPKEPPLGCGPCPLALPNLPVSLPTPQEPALHLELAIHSFTTVIPSFACLRLL